MSNYHKIPNESAPKCCTDACICQSSSFRCPGAMSAPDHQKLMDWPHARFSTAFYLCKGMTNYKLDFQYGLVRFYKGFYIRIPELVHIHYIWCPTPIELSAEATSYFRYCFPIPNKYSNNSTNTILGTILPCQYRSCRWSCDDWRWKDCSPQV